MLLQVFVCRMIHRVLCSAWYINCLLNHFSNKIFKISSFDTLNYPLQAMAAISTTALSSTQIVFVTGIVSSVPIACPLLFQCIHHQQQLKSKLCFEQEFIWFTVSKLRLCLTTTPSPTQNLFHFNLWGIGACGRIIKTKLTFWLKK